MTFPDFRTWRRDNSGTVADYEAERAAAQSIPNVEVLTIRDPDGPTQVHVFYDGVEITPTEHHVDPGYGYALSDWRAGTEHVRRATGYSDAFRDAVVAARIEAEDSSYIERDVDDEPAPPWRSPARIEFLSDILTLAMEGGIGYWAMAVDWKRGVPGNELAWTEITVVDQEGAIDLGYDPTDLRDRWGEDETMMERLAPHKHTVTLDGIASAVGKIVRREITVRSDLADTISRASRENDAVEIDADGADLLFQIAALGEVTYG